MPRKTMWDFHRSIKKCKVFFNFISIYINSNEISNSFQICIYTFMRILCFLRENLFVNLHHDIEATDNSRFSAVLRSVVESFEFVRDRLITKLISRGLNHLSKMSFSYRNVSI